MVNAAIRLALVDDAEGYKFRARLPRGWEARYMRPEIKISAPDGSEHLFEASRMFLARCDCGIQLHSSKMTIPSHCQSCGKPMRLEYGDTSRTSFVPMGPGPGPDISDDADEPTDPGGPALVEREDSAP